MPAKEAAIEAQQVEGPAQAPPEAADPAKAMIQTEGDVPAVDRGGPTPATATASQLAFEGDGKGDSSSIDHGVFQPEEYKHACEAAGKEDKWKEMYRNGYTKSDAWASSAKGTMKFDLKKGNSASEAIKSWFRGPTVADFRTISVAEQLDELRDELGDHKFDEVFGSANGAQDKLIPGGQRLQISLAMYTTPFIDQMKAVARQHDDKINKPEAQTPPAITPPEEEKAARPTNSAQAKHDTQAGQDTDLANTTELGFGRDDLQRA
ncbi:hypothetical protein BH11MYX3_BH11MYX3_22780 [soil metagenome]